MPEVTIIQAFQKNGQITVNAKVDGVFVQTTFPKTDLDAMSTRANKLKYAAQQAANQLNTIDITGTVTV